MPQNHIISRSSFVRIELISLLHALEINLLPSQANKIIPFDDELRIYKAESEHLVNAICMSSADDSNSLYNAEELDDAIAFFLGFLANFLKNTSHSGKLSPLQLDRIALFREYLLNRHRTHCAFKWHLFKLYLVWSDEYYLPKIRWHLVRIFGKRGILKISCAAEIG